MKIIPIATSNGSVASTLLSLNGPAFCSAELKTLHA
jgi:hypothetical protein